MTKRLVSFVVLIVMAAFAPVMAQAQIQRSREYGRYWTNQIIRDFSPGGYYTQPGWWVNGLTNGGYPFQTGYNNRYGRRNRFVGPASQDNMRVDMLMDGLSLGVGIWNTIETHKTNKKLDRVQREQEEIRHQQTILINQQQQQMQRERQEPQQMERPFLRNGEGFIQGIAFTNDTNCVVTLFNDHLNQQQDVRPGRTTKSLPWRFEDVQAFAFIEGQYTELDLEFQGNRVVITTPED